MPNPKQETPAILEKIHALYEKSKEKARGRVPPEQFLTTPFPVLHAGSVPTNLTEANYDLDVYGEVENPVTLKFKDIQTKFPKTNIVEDIHCVTHWTKLDMPWAGVKFSDLMKLVKPTKKANFVIFEAEEGWTTNLPMEDCMKDNVLIAYEYEAKPITSQHGGPVRMVVPHKYFWKSAKWLRKIRLVEKDEPGFWEVRGYNTPADPWKNERYS